MKSSALPRVVLARELESPEIEHICKNCTAEIEVFVHGALYCAILVNAWWVPLSVVAVVTVVPAHNLAVSLCELLDSSGTSLLHLNTRAYLLSPKDLNYSRHMNELVAAGVTVLLR